MKKFDSFYFEKYEFDQEKLLAKFYYSFDQEYFFEEEIDFSSDFFVRGHLDEKVINNFLFSIHLSLWISYYKAFPTNNLFIKSGFLNDEQIKFWQKFYKNWLWEFLYQNNIKPNNLFNFKNLLSSDKKIKFQDFKTNEKALINLGWWKDSSVSIDMFQKNNFDFDLYVFWKNDSIKQNFAKKLSKNILLTKRKISDNLLELNKLWNYNWHVPITWIIAFCSIFVAYLYDYKYIVLSNEKSASSWNTFWNWFEINHQWSKSLEFETDFMEYINKNLSKNIYYFSLLRWFYEYKIWEYFALNCKKYFSIFSSCNNNFKIDENKRLKNTLWCNNCPKCAFTFALLRPFLLNEEVIQIFWEDLFFKKDLEKTFLELLWIDWIKPFECVWEVEEVVLCFYKSYFLYSEKPQILQIFDEKVIKKYDEKYFEDLEKKLWNIYDEDIIPLVIKNKILKNKNQF